jgi:hypothetical protein
MRNDIVQHVIAQTACDREDAQNASLEEKTASPFDSSDFQWIIHTVIVRESDPLTLARISADFLNNREKSGKAVGIAQHRPKQSYTYNADS